MEGNDVQKWETRPSQNSVQAQPLQWKRAALMTKTITAFKETISIDSDNDDVDTKQQIKYGKPSQAAWAILSEYCDHSTIHGMKYLGEHKRPWWERIFWIIVFGVSIYTCAALIMNIWYKWNYNPVIVSFAEKSTPVWEIPFPTITICPENKAPQTIFNYTDAFWKLKDFHSNITHEYPTNEELANFYVLSQVCDHHIIQRSKADADYAKGIDIITRLSQIMPAFRETFLRCKWRNSLQNCANMFSKFITDDGMCYSFNSLSLEEIYRQESLLPELMLHIENRTATDWNVEDGYSSAAQASTYPKRVLGPGTKAGLELLLNGYEKDFDNLCRGPIQGFKILLQTPGELPLMGKRFFRIPFDQEILISIKPKIITTSVGLKHYEPNKRQCYFQKERELRYFQIYSQNNCELECLANFTLTECGCVKYSMPRNTTVPVCGPKKIPCLYEAEDKLALKEFKQGVAAATSSYRAATTCNCLPACTSIAYEAEISQSDYDYKSLAELNGETNEKDKLYGAKKTRLSIFFKEAQFLTSKRSELYGTTEFLANCGGLLGLFMGVSTLSIVEIIYFCTVRLATNLKMRHKKRKELQNYEDKTA
ncbi:pickpocket protein 28 [Glossina fuscipes]|uniref:Pickpocket protein 28 n=1 Tax=Glossina fuscipes TaxID=7396 RepID=A0A8U0W722_9MUSC|nr:pickpocket protein 28 [Glossina fuscipes]